MCVRPRARVRAHSGVTTRHSPDCVKLFARIHELTEMSVEQNMSILKNALQLSGVYV
jgi:hypothetical protein